jgi:hypothetical protein
VKEHGVEVIPNEQNSTIKLKGKIDDMRVVKVWDELNVTLSVVIPFY